MQSNPWLARTQRLCFRPFDERDAARVFALSREESMRRGIPNQVYETPEEARDVTRELAMYAARGEMPFVMAMVHAQDGVLIGHVGLSDVADGVEIGYAVAEDYQGRGLAREAVAACTAYFGQRFALASLYGIALCENTASRRVLEACGYAYQGDRRQPGGAVSVYLYTFSSAPSA